MGKYIIRRLLASIPTLFFVSVVIFMLVRLQPGDVLIANLDEGGYYTEEQLVEIRAELGIDRAWPVQYVDWASHVIRGDFGASLVNRQKDVLPTIAKRARISVQLAIMSMAVAIAIAVPLGVISAVKLNSPIDYAARLFSVLGLSIPDYFIATMLLYALSVWIGWLPQFGYFALWEDPWRNFQAMIFPSLIVGYRFSAISARMTRSAMLEVLNEDYIRTARSKGLTDRVVILRHALRNSLIPVVTIMGSQLSFLLGGLVIIEIIFSLPGIGSLAFLAIQQRDYTVVQGVVMVTAVVFIIGNLLVDLSYALIDPRIRYT